MTRRIAGLSFVVALCLMVSSVIGAPRGGGGRAGGGAGGGGAGGRPSGGAHHGGGKPPGGNWSEGRPGGTQGPQSFGGAHAKPHNPSGSNDAAAGAAAHKRNQPQHSNGEDAAAGAAASNRRKPQTSGADGAAAGAAASKRNQPDASGAQGAAAGAAAANRNAPKTSGAEGAAAGAAAANRNAPKTSGAEGAAAGAAAANRNQPNVSGAQGAAAGAAVANRNQPNVSGAAGAAAGAAAVRNSFDHPNLYGQQWHGDHPDAWSAAGWAAGAAYRPATWAVLAGQNGYNNTPTYYNYGSNVTCVDGNVQVDGESVGTAEEFSQQAASLAQAGSAAETQSSDEWLPLGVFALVRNEQQHPQLILQLAINKQGILRGNYTDQVSDTTLPIQGSVDSTSQRAAWTVGSNTSTVMEVGLSNLTQEEAPALLHKHGKTERWLLVRLNQPEQNGN